MVQLYYLGPVPEQVNNIGMSGTVVIYRKYRMYSVYVDVPEFLKFFIFYGVGLGHLKYEGSEMLAVLCDQLV